MKYRYTKKRLTSIIEYFDEIYKDNKLKTRLFKRYGKNKEYSVKKYVARHYYPKSGLVIKTNRVYVDLRELSFIMKNNLFGVLNLHLYHNAILKVVPSFNKIFEYNKKDFLNKRSKRRITLNHILHLIDEKTDEPFPISTSLKQHLTIQDFFNDLEKVLREYIVIRDYEFRVQSIEVLIKYSYYETKTNKKKSNK